LDFCDKHDLNAGAGEFDAHKKKDFVALAATSKKTT
jgi:hypothetical protein